MHSNLSKQVAELLGASLGTSYAVVGYGGVNSHQVGSVGTLAYRAEATFKAGTAVTSMTFKVQVARTLAEETSATSTLWTDLALADAKAPGTAPTVEWVINAQAAKTVPLDLFSELAHRGRPHFRVLAKIAGTGATGDGFAAFTTSRP